MIEPRTGRRLGNSRVKVHCPSCGSVKRRILPCRFCSRLRATRPMLPATRLARLNPVPASGNALDEEWSHV